MNMNSGTQPALAPAPFEETSLYQNGIAGNQSRTTRILGIGSSPRPGGNSDILLDHLLKGASTLGAQTEAIQLRDLNIYPCIGCEQCRVDQRCTGLNDDMQTIYPKINQSSGLILISPTHNYNVTAWMKAFIDRLYCFYVFNSKERLWDWHSMLADQNRKAVIATVGKQTRREDMGFTLEAMRRPLQSLGYAITGELAVFGLFDAGKVAEQPDVLIQSENIGARLCRTLQEQVFEVG